MAAAFEFGVSIRGIGFRSMPQPHILDRTKNEMELFTNKPGTEFKGQIILAFAITLGGINLGHEEHALAVFAAFFFEIERVVNGIEAESRRLGFTQ